MIRGSGMPPLRCAAAVLAWLVLAASCDRASADAGAKLDRAAGSLPSGRAAPNVVLIVLDTARADRMSYNGYERVTTPHIDGLARDGVVFRNAHSVAPWTLPSHMSMFTGLLPSQHGATWAAFGTPEDASLGDVLERSLTPAQPSRLLPQRLRGLGYTSIGFTSNAWVSRRTGFASGFDAFYEIWKQSPALARSYRWLPPRLRSLRWLPLPVRMLSDADAGDAGGVVRLLREHVREHGLPPEPFFLFFNFIDPHFPYAPPAPWRYAFSDDVDLGESLAGFEFSEIALVAGERPVDVARFVPFYDAEISYVDFAVGRVLTWLREHGFYDDALVIVTSDHGEHLGEGGRFSHQFSIAEELLQVPLVVKFPGSVGSGRVVEDPLVSNLDVYATILAAAGANPGVPVTPSRDLRDPDALDRSHLIAEYAYAIPFLRAHQKQYPAFSLEENRVIRRVVYDREGRHVFVQRDAGEAQPPGDEGSRPGRERAAAVLREYVEGLGGGGAQVTDEPLDAKSRQLLRSLGYAD